MKLLVQDLTNEKKRSEIRMDINIGDKVFYVVMQDWYIVENIETQNNITYFISTHNGKEISMHQDYITNVKSESKTGTKISTHFNCAGCKRRCLTDEDYSKNINMYGEKLDWACLVKEEEIDLKLDRPNCYEEE